MKINLKVENIPIEMNNIKINRIAFVMPWHISERGGGSEVQANYLAQELTQRNIEIHYICQTTNKNKIRTTQSFKNVTIHWLKSSGRFPWLDQKKYKIALKSIQPELVIQRMSSNVTSVIGNYCKVNHIPFVWLCTDNKTPFTDFHFSKFKERSTTKSLEIVKYMLFAISNKLMDYYRNKGMKLIDIAFNQNDFQEEKLKNNYNLESQRMISGHPLPKLKLSSLERFKKQTILWCANFGAHKRPELFIELASKMQHTNLKFVMVGGHSDLNYVNKLLKNKPKNLTITGKLSFEEALKYFDEATLLINSSISEGFSNTYIQAWLRGVPTVVFGADPDGIILNNNLGYNISVTDEAAQKIETLFNNYKSYKMLSDNGYAYALKNHSIKKMTDNFLKQLVDEGIALH